MDPGHSGLAHLRAASGLVFRGLRQRHHEGVEHTGVKRMSDRSWRVLLRRGLTPYRTCTTFHTEREAIAEAHRWLDGPCCCGVMGRGGDEDEEMGEGGGGEAGRGGDEDEEMGEGGGGPILELPAAVQEPQDAVPGQRAPREVAFLGAWSYHLWTRPVTRLVADELAYLRDVIARSLVRAPRRVHLPDPSGQGHFHRYPDFFLDTRGVRMLPFGEYYEGRPSSHHYKPDGFMHDAATVVGMHALAQRLGVVPFIYIIYERDDTVGRFELTAAHFAAAAREDHEAIMGHFRDMRGGERLATGEFYAIGGDASERIRTSVQSLRDAIARRLA